MTSNMKEGFTQLGSLLATIMFFYGMFMKFFPTPLVTRYINKFTNMIYPYISITFSEFTGERLMRSVAYTSIQTYLSEHSSQQAKRLKAEVVRNSHNPLVLSMDDNQEIMEEFQGVKVWWTSYKITPKTASVSLHASQDEKRYYKLTFHKNHRKLITESYLKHVLEEARVIELKNRQLKLYTNSNNTKWSHVIFEHPATFETLAMKLRQKEDIINDLMNFKMGKKYYEKIGKAWKRGYLLFGPPGSGKSTMIVAMANFLNYDVYDLELTSVKDNSDLRTLLINTSSKSIIVIEDIDCSLDLTGQRKNKKKEEKFKGRGEVDIENDKGSKVTLSGLLNVIDGIWSACGGERIMIFTTNYVDKLDHALIRRGRMDVHIELSYCCFEAFKVLAKNYLDVESHYLFPKIKDLLDEVKITPADVAENLMPKSLTKDKDTCLENLVHALEKELKESYIQENKESKSLTEDKDTCLENLVHALEKELKESYIQENKESIEEHDDGMKDV